MTYWLSEPVSALFPNDSFASSDGGQPTPADHLPHLEVDILIVGSGYGAAMAATALAEAGVVSTSGKRIWVFERGEEYVPGDFPKTIADLPGYVQVTARQGRRHVPRALWDIRVGDGVTTVAGNGLGGGSLVNAGVVMPPDARLFTNWPSLPGVNWLTDLRPSVDRVRGILDSNPHPSADNIRKYSALEKVAAISAKHCRPAEIAVSFSTQTNASGVHQQACTDCGNCVTGCNIGAKNTLNMNAWPAARSGGVELYTMATVLSVEPHNTPSGRGWRVHAHVTRAPDHRFIVTAAQVILAAGTLGSTEILMRSREEHGLKVSERLGKGFSCNGDFIASGFGQRTPVLAGAESPSVAGEFTKHSPAVGPTIVGCAQFDLLVPGNDTQNRRVTIEDSAIPFPLLRAWGELLTTQAFAREYTTDSPADWLVRHPGHDRTACSPDAMRHSQTLLLMGEDDQCGELKLSAVEGAGDVALPSWPRRPKQATAGSADPLRYYEALDNYLNTTEGRGGFDGGYYLGPPWWRVFPASFEDVVQGADLLGRRLLTVHPLGGCCLGRDASDGVVNVDGEVYDASNGNAVHDGLFVMDGAIIPRPLGINPLLTISALAHWMAGRLARRHQGSQQAPPPVITVEPPSDWRELAVRGYHVGEPRDQRVDLHFNERLLGKVIDDRIATVLAKGHGGAKRRVSGSPEDVARNLQMAGGLVIDIDTEIDDVVAWLANNERTLPARFTVCVSYVPSDDDAQTVPSMHLEPLFEAQGLVRLLVRDHPGRFARTLRALSAVLRFLLTRGDEILRKVTAYLPLVGESRSDTDGKPARASLPEIVRGYCRTARLHGQWRYIEYEFDHRFDSGEVIRFEGRKECAYGLGKPNIWRALTELPYVLTLREDDDERKDKAVLKVDLIRMARDIAPFQVTRSPNTLVTVQTMLSFAALFLRMMMQNQFWKFGAPDYAAFPDKESANKPRREDLPDRLPYTADGKAYSARCTTYKPDDSSKAKAVLVRYRPEHCSCEKSEPVLLIHGLALSSWTFVTPTIDTNMAQYFLAQGADVWLLDYRTSIRLISAKESTSMDEIAEYDMPWAVNTVHEKVNKPVLVFAHCIGAACFSMSVLGGWQTSKKIKKIALHAVPPWLVASQYNRFRGNAIGLFKDRIALPTFSPIPDNRPHPLEVLLDRIASSFPWTEQDRRRHNDCCDANGPQYSRTVCNRMTMIYGYEWQHANLALRTHSKLHSLCGPATTDMLRHIYFCVLRGRLTARDGGNKYVQEDLFSKYWEFPTLFLHGVDNNVFNVKSSRVSARRLAKIRVKENQRPAWDNRTDIAKKLAEQNVWIYEIPRYGHMDPLFGEKAHEHVYPRLCSFLLGVKPVDSALLDIDMHGGISSSPTTGPIISRPDRANHTLRVWAETEEFQTSVTNELGFSEGGTKAIPVKWHLKPGVVKDDLRRNVFWIGDLTLKGVANPVLMSVPFPSRSIGIPNVPDNRKVKHLPLNIVPVGRNGFESPTARVQSLPLSLFTYAPRYGYQPCEFDWPSMPWYRRVFGTGKENQESAPRLAFLVGSCLHPGSPFEQEQSDGVFAAMLPHVEGTDGHYGVDHLLLVGDQIYADATAGIFEPREMRERYRERYRRAFGGYYKERGVHASKVLSHVPTYCAVDDHEIADNWPDSPGGQSTSEEFKSGVAEAWNFQMHHGKTDNNGSLTRDLWYSFSSAGFDFFVFDTRTQRCRRGQADRNKRSAIVCDDQWGAFCNWVKDLGDPDRPVFIVTGSPMGPVPEAYESYPSLTAYEDNLLAFPGFLIEVAELLNSAKLESVVWISGDQHLSSCSTVVVTVSQDGREPITVTMLQVVSSGLFASIPFSNDRQDRYVWGHPTCIKYPLVSRSRGATTTLKIATVPYLLCDSFRHFTRADLEHDSAGWHMKLTACDAEGRAGETVVLKLPQ